MFERFRLWLLTKLIREYVRGHRPGAKWSDVLTIYWKEHRTWFKEENIPTTRGSIDEVWDECIARERAFHADATISLREYPWHKLRVGDRVISKSSMAQGRIASLSEWGPDYYTTDLTKQERRDFDPDRDHLIGLKWDNRPDEPVIVYPKAYLESVGRSY